MTLEYCSVNASCTAMQIVQLKQCMQCNEVYTVHCTIHKWWVLAPPPGIIRPPLPAFDDRTPQILDDFKFPTWNAFWGWLSSSENVIWEKKIPRFCNEWCVKMWMMDCELIFRCLIADFFGWQWHSFSAQNILMLGNYAMFGARSYCKLPTELRLDLGLW